jgi:hypothetical protein
MRPILCLPTNPRSVMNEEIRLDDIVNWYSEHLRGNHPKNLARFEADRKRDYEAAVAEAITFHVLSYRNVHPEVHEEAGTGGADFVCWASMNPFAKRTSQNEFIVEATAISQEAVTRRSGIPTEITGLGGGAIGLLTPNFWRKAQRKCEQLKQYRMPRVLSIVSSHVGASVLINSATAFWAFTSEEFFRHEIGKAEADPNRYADLKNSVFLELTADGKIVPRRKEISAILLIAVDGAASTVFGMLHPEPEYPFNIEFLPDVPFLHVANWPALDNRLRFLWAVAHPSGLNVRHYQLARHLVRNRSSV